MVSVDAVKAQNLHVGNYHVDTGKCDNSVYCYDVTEYGAVRE